MTDQAFTKALAEVGEIRANNDAFVKRAVKRLTQTPVSESAGIERAIADLLLAIHGELRIANVLKTSL